MVSFFLPSLSPDDAFTWWQKPPIPPPIHIHRPLTPCTSPGAGDITGPSYAPAHISSSYSFDNLTLSRGIVCPPSQDLAAHLPGLSLGGGGPLGVKGLHTCPGTWGGPESGHTVKARTEEVKEGAGCRSDGG